ncbi:prepilin peptidase [Glaciibacter superstes]|uniref:prepilin peptidase n=1 Tax=Glaciibacter superstes TaxID=501023 RepID=UPI0003B4FC25|nr:A24 family peptidase [Glaciibacter superstes]
MIPALFVCLVFMLGGIAGGVLQRWLWRHLPQLGEAPPPGLAADIGTSVATAVATAGAAAMGGATWSGLAYCIFALFAVQIAVVDWRSSLIPNILVIPAAIVGLGLLLLAALTEGRWDDLIRGAAGASGLFLAYLILALVSPTGLGMGDVKLAASVGLYLGFQSWTALILGAAAGFIIGACVSLVLLAFRRAKLRTNVPFGPSMLAGTALVLVAAGLAAG